MPWQKPHVTAALTGKVSGTRSAQTEGLSCSATSAQGSQQPPRWSRTCRRKSAFHKRWSSQESHGLTQGLLWGGESPRAGRQGPFSFSRARCSSQDKGPGPPGVSRPQPSDSQHMPKPHRPWVGTRTCSALGLGSSQQCGPGAPRG